MLRLLLSQRLPSLNIAVGDLTGVVDITTPNTSTEAGTALRYTGFGWLTQRLSLTDLAELNGITPSNGQVIKWDSSLNGGNGAWSLGSDLTASGGSGISLTDLSVSQVAAGTNALSYDNTTGIFQFTPADLSGLAPLVHTHTASDITDF